MSSNDAQLRNQLEGRSVKGQVRALGLAEVAKRAVTAVFEVKMSARKSVDRYRQPLAQLSVVGGEPRELVEQARTTMGLGEKDVVPGREKVQRMRPRIKNRF
jgi:chitin synthase